MRKVRLTALALALLAFLPETAGAAGLPQLNVETYVPQVIWLAISFVALYLLMARIALPRVGQVLEERQHRIDSNLERAEKLKAEADASREAYETSMAEARAEAQRVVGEASARVAAEAAERHAELATRLAEDIKAAEGRIDEAKEKAIADIRGVAAEIATAATGRLIGDSPDTGDVSKVIDSVIEERS